MKKKKEEKKKLSHKNLIVVSVQGWHNPAQAEVALSFNAFSAVPPTFLDEKLQKHLGDSEETERWDDS